MVRSCYASSRRCSSSSASIPTISGVTAIQLGDDTDTTACLVGGICGGRDGVEAIPKRWLDALRGRDLCDPLIAELVRQRE